MSFYKLNDELKNKKFKVNLASREKLLAWYIFNYTRLCRLYHKQKEKIIELENDKRVLEQSLWEEGKGKYE